MNKATTKVETKRKTTKKILYEYKTIYIVESDYGDVLYIASKENLAITFIKESERRREERRHYFEARVRIPAGQVVDTIWVLFTDFAHLFFGTKKEIMQKKRAIDKKAMAKSKIEYGNVKYACLACIESFILQ